MYPVIYTSYHIHIASYLIIMSLAYTVSIFYFYKRAIQLHLSPKLSTEISIAIMLGGFLGARIFHVIFEYPQYYWDHPLEFFKVYNGGFVFYGGFIGAFLCAYFYISKIKQNFSHWLDAFALVLPIGYMIGRIGCLLAGCCYGKTCYLPWAMTFGPGVEAPSGVPLHPTQIYFILLEGLVWISLFYIEKKRDKLTIFRSSGSLFYLWMILHGIERLIVEQFRGDFRGQLWAGLSISSYISTILIAIGFFMLSKGQHSHNKITK